jgi:hypothetical protein
MKLDAVVKELRKDNWLTGITFIEDNRDFLQALVDETEKQLTTPIVRKSVSINRINELTKEIEDTCNDGKLLALRDDYAINLATEFGGSSWDYLPNGKFNVSYSYSDSDVSDIVLEMNNAAMCGRHGEDRFKLQDKISWIKTKWKR